MDASRCKPGNKAYGESDCIRDQTTTMDVERLPAMVRRAQGGRPSSRPCGEKSPPRTELACFKLCFPSARAPGG